LPFFFGLRGLLFFLLYLWLGSAITQIVLIFPPIKNLACPPSIQSSRAKLYGVLWLLRP
jgi:membrane-anchored glycerophosphoryl diester phosphodiesterase (GDPDase)